MQTSTAPLTPAMLELIKVTAPGAVMKPGATRAALIRRELVHPLNTGSVSAGTLTPAGEQIRAKALPALAVEIDNAKALYAEMTTSDLIDLREQGVDMDAPEDVARMDEELDRRMEAPKPQTPAQRTAVEGDRNAKARRENEQGLPQRIPGEALTEELTGEALPAESDSAASGDSGVDTGTPEGDSAVLVEHSGRAGHVAQVLLRDVRDSRGGVYYDRMSREIFIATGSAWGSLMGRQVRIAAEHGDVIHKRRLTIVLATPGIVLWENDGDRSVSAGLLRRGDTLLIDGVRTYQVQQRDPADPMSLRCLD